MPLTDPQLSASHSHNRQRYDEHKVAIHRFDTYDLPENLPELPDDLPESRTESTDDSEDFVEFQLGNPRYRRSTVQVIDRDLAKVEEEARNRVRQQAEVPEPEGLSETESDLVSSDADLSTASDEEEWKEMETRVEFHDIYDIKGEAIEKLFNEPVPVADKLVTESTTSLNGNTEYTRVAVQAQATKYNEMDKHFNFLFEKENNNLKVLRQSNSEAPNWNREAFDEIFQEFDEARAAENELTVGSQLLTTRNMLTGAQKIAYAALVKLTMVDQHMKLNDNTGSGSTSVMKKLSNAQKSYTRWSMNVMDDLYDHLGITQPEEKVMIENLSCHGVEPNDLVIWFDSNLVVKNSLKDDASIIAIGDNEDSFDIDIRWTLLCDLFLVLLESSIYDSRSRTMILLFANYLGINNLEVYQFERRITNALEMEELTSVINSQSWTEKDIIREHRAKRRGKKLVKVAFATVAGGLVIGLSAGALAPVIGAGLAAGFSTIGIGGTAGLLGGTAGTSIITAGATLTGMKMGHKGMNNRAGSVKTFEFRPLHNNGRLNLTLTISGWMSGTADDVRLPFSTVDPVMGDIYSLLWEPDILRSTGKTMNILANEILTQSLQQILGATFLTTLMAGIMLPNWLAKLGYIIDNPWSVSLGRAAAAGHILADTLRRSKLGMRPITLIGFSLGSRVIWTCLQDLAKTGDYGLIENVYMFGSPVVIDENSVALARSTVSGRFVNGYSQRDWILGYLFRATSGGLRTVAGLTEIDGLENIDCTELVTGHMEYRKAMPKLLKRLGWEVLSEEFVEIQEPDAETTERQRKLIGDFEKAQAAGTKPKSWYGKLFGKKNKEWWEMYEKSTKEQKEREANEPVDPELVDVEALENQVQAIQKMAGKSGLNLDIIKTKDNEPPVEGMKELKLGKNKPGKRTASLNLNVVQSQSIANLALPDREPTKEQHSQPDPPQEEHIEICFDDDFDKAEEMIRNSK